MLKITASPVRVVQSSPFLMEMGGIFSHEMPREGLVFDCLRKEILDAGSGRGLAEVPTTWKWEGGFRYFSTALGRQAGARDCWGDTPISRGAILTVARQRLTAPRCATLGEMQVLDLWRFTMQTRSMFLVSPNSILRGELRVQRVGETEVAGFFPSTGGIPKWDMFFGGRFSFSAKAETLGGEHGRWEKSHESNPRAPFFHNKTNGTMTDGEGGVLAVNLPQSVRGGIFSHVNWGLARLGNSTVDLAGEVAALGEAVGKGRRGPSFVGGGVERHGAGALAELLHCQCHHSGPAGATTMRARACLVDGGWGVWLRTSGNSIRSRDKEEWSRAKNAELLKLGLTGRALGLNDTVLGFSNLEKVVSGVGKGQRRGGRVKGEGEKSRGFKTR